MSSPNVITVTVTISAVSTPITESDLKAFQESQLGLDFGYSPQKLFGANRGPRPSADGLAFPTKTKTF